MDLEAEARAVLPDHVARYFAAAYGSGASHLSGLADWEAVRFRPRVLRDVSQLDLTTRVLGTSVQTPVLVAPMAQQVAAHADGEAATGRAVRQAGSLLGVSTNTAVSFADIAASGAPWWYQVYVARDRSLTERLVERAVEHGARALILTVDLTTWPAPDAHPRSWPEGPAKARITNLSAAERAAVGPAALALDLSLTFEDIGWLVQLGGLPVLVKGVMRADDAIRCVDAGASGVVVSTHGGRRSATAVSSARALPEVVAALHGRAEVYVDSGIRRAEHVAVALAMGARAVFVGRPVLWALAARGEEGVLAVLDALTAELAQVMAQLGAATLTDLTPDLLA